jgi:hypothetical protein
MIRWEAETRLTASLEPIRQAILRDDCLRFYPCGSGNNQILLDIRSNRVARPILIYRYPKSEEGEGFGGMKRFPIGTLPGGGLNESPCQVS